MQIYRVYHHPHQGYTAITSGFNWAAAAFSLIWTLSNNLWTPSALLFLGWSAGITGMLVTKTFNMPELSMTFLAIAVLMPLWAGMQATLWQDKQLQKKGYHLINKVRAQTAKGAIQTTQQKQQPKAAKAHAARR